MKLREAMEYSAEMIEHMRPSFSRALDIQRGEAAETLRRWMAFCEAAEKEFAHWDVRDKEDDNAPLETPAPILLSALDLHDATLAAYRAAIAEEAR